MERNKLRFSLSHLENYAIIKEPCTALVKNNSVLDIDNLYEDDGHNRWIINLKAITEKNLNLIKKIVSENELVTYWDIGHLLMKGAIWEDQVFSQLDLPVRGENVIATFDYVNGDLLCTNITLIPKVQLELYTPAKELLDEISKFIK